MKKIETIHVVIGESADANGSPEEGVPAAMIGGQWSPLVIAHERNIDTICEFAQQIADATGKSLKLVKFVKTEIIKEIKPIDL